MPQDYAEAAKWYRRAAEAGLAEAQNDLGMMYYIGQGVLQDYATAVTWYHRAAEAGVAEAQHNLAFMYANGHGVPQSAVVAHMWFNLAASKSYDQATKARDALAPQMSKAAVERAQARAAQCLASDYQDCGG